MNYYQRFTGDYQGKTQHLSLAEHGAYTVLLDIYYTTEKPLVSDEKSLFRLCRAMDKDEQAAVRSVLSQFFPVGHDGLRHNERADKEIEKARPRMESASINGKKGGRPRNEKSALGSENETQKEPSGFPLGSENETQKEPSGFPLGSENETQKEPSGFPLGSENETQKEPSGKAPHTPILKPPNPLAEAKGESPGEIASLENQAVAKLPTATPCDHDGVISAYHEILPELPRVAVWGKERERKLKARWQGDKRHQTLDFWRWFFESARSNPHWLGDNGKGWRADLEWFLSPTNFARVIERGIAAQQSRAA